MRNIFHQRLAELLKENRMTQKELAKEIGSSESIVSDWLNQKSIPSIEYLYIIAEFFAVPADYLLGRQNWY